MPDKSSIRDWDRNLAVVSMRRTGATRREVAEHFGLSIPRIGQIEIEVSAAQVRACSLSNRAMNMLRQFLPFNEASNGNWQPNCLDVSKALDGIRAETPNARKVIAEIEAWLAT